MRIPQIRQHYTAISTTVKVIRKGKNIVKQAVRQTEIMAMDEQLKNKAMSTIIMATSFMPQMNSRLAKLSAEALDNQDVFVKKASKVTSATAEKVTKTIGNKSVKVKLESAKPKFHDAFNNLLLQNEKHKNPLNDKAVIFDKRAKEYGVDPYVLMGIAMHESGRGTSDATKLRHNVGGIMKNGSLKKFPNIDKCVEEMAQTVSKHHHKSRLRTVKELAEAGYCGENEKAEWISNVMDYIRELRNNVN